VILATHNRREMLRRCLEALARQTQPPDGFEVIVADDGSTDGTAEMVGAFEAPYALRLLALEKSSHAAAQNAALAVSSAPVCLLLDDDVIASPELVAAHVEGHRRHPRAIGIGALTQEPVAAKDWYAHAFARGWREHYEELATREAHWMDCYGANLSARRSAFEEIGWVSTDIPSAKDFDLALRLSAAGCKPVYLPAAHGVHDDQKRSNRMLVDAERAGAMHVALSQRYPYAGPELLDWGASVDRRELALRRVCLALHVPASLLAPLGGLIPGEGRKMLWQHFVRRLAFWTGVRRNVNRRAWALLLQGSTAAAVADGLGS
jgi:GT2 family glycosyltransferase